MAVPSAPLPEGWSQHTDPASGNLFYQNQASGETTWVRPVSEYAPTVLPTHFPLPDGWSEHVDPTTAKSFYHCAATGETSWVRPVPAPSPVPLVAPSAALAPVAVVPDVPTGLPGAFLCYLKAHPEVLDSIREYQAANCHLFLGQESEEYPLEATDAYNAFVALIDKHLSAFLREYGATPDMFADALLDLKRANDPHWMAFDLLLRKVDFPTVANLMRTNTCLCCGGVFMNTRR